MSAVIELPRVTLAQAAVRPEMDFVLPGLLAGSVGMIVGQGAVGKSMLALSIGLAVASGRPVAGGLWPAPVPGPVTIIAGEDAPVVLQDRLHWLRHAEGIDQAAAEQIDDAMDVRSGVGFDMRILVSAGGGIGAGPFVESFTALCYGRRLVIVDPLAFLHDGNENDNGVATMLMQTLAGIARETGCTILVLHHVSKGAGQGGEDWTAARGASALTTAVRLQINITPPSKTELEQYGIDESMRRSWCRVATVKTNYGPPPPDGWLRRGEGGVLERQQMRGSPPPPRRSGGKKSEWAADMSQKYGMRGDDDGCPF